MDNGEEIMQSKPIPLAKSIWYQTYLARNIRLLQPKPDRLKSNLHPKRIFPFHLIPKLRKIRLFSTFFLQDVFGSSHAKCIW